MQPSQMLILGTGRLDSMGEYRYRLAHILPVATSGLVLSMQGFVIDASASISASNEIAVRPF